MKKVAAIVMALIMALASMGAACASSYDYTQLEGIEGYSYDKFERSWRICDTYCIDYSNLRLYIGVQAEEISGYLLPFVFIKLTGYGSETPWEIEGIDVYIDGLIYSFDSPFHPDGSGEYDFFGYSVNKLIRALAAAEKEVAVRIRHSAASPEFDLDWEKFGSGIGRIAKVLVDNGVMDATTQNQVFDYYEDQHKPVIW